METPTPTGANLLHTYDGSLLSQLKQHLGKHQPRRLFAISPFHDNDCGLIKRMLRTWPKSKLELVVQQGYTNLRVEPAQKLGARLRLAAIRNATRRLHAKLLAWDEPAGQACLIGSANLTSAAFDGRNVEACLLIPRAGELIEGLFDGNFPAKPLALENFKPGTQPEPGDDEDDEDDEVQLRLSSAVLREGTKLALDYAASEDTARLRVDLRAPNEPKPRWSKGFARSPSGTTILTLPDEAIAKTGHALLATLQSNDGNTVTTSAPAWIVLERYLTYESTESTQAARKRVEDTGVGLVEYLDEIAAREGVAAAVEMLKHLSIRFQDGESGRLSTRTFRIQSRDPYRGDGRPDWLQQLGEDAPNLEQAIYDFADRHYQYKLQKHVDHGNVNGLPNFVDILTTIVRLLFAYYLDGLVNRNQVVGRLCDYLDTGTCGREENDREDGLLYTLHENLDGDSELLQEACDETQYISVLMATLLIAQTVRFVPDEKIPGFRPAKRPRECLPMNSKHLRETVSETGLDLPTPDDVRETLEKFFGISGEHTDALIREL